MILAVDLRSWTDFVLGIANTAADLSFRIATAKLTKPSHKAAALKAGGMLRAAREVAGLTLGDLGRAINLKDTSRLEQVQRGKVGLPFEIILRLAGVLWAQRPDPDRDAVDAHLQPEALGHAREPGCRKAARCRRAASVGFRNSSLRAMRRGSRTTQRPWQR